MKHLIDKKSANRRSFGKIEQIVLAVAVFALALGLYMLGSYALDTVRSKNASQSLIDESVTVLETTAPEADAVTPPVESEAPPAESEKPSELPIEVDFEKLLETNPDIVAWIYSADTPINTAVPHRAGNDVYYLCHSSTRENNRYGTIFVAGDCSPDFSDPNTILYGHDMQNGTILGTLELYSEQQYFENHRVMYLLTPEQNYRAEVVAGYMHTADCRLYEMPNSREYTESFVTTAIAESVFNSGASYSPDANYLTFSTCSDLYEGARLAIVCRLVPLEK